MKKFMVCIMTLALALSLASCAGKTAPEEFTVNGEMSITLDGGFKQYDPIESIGVYSAIFDSSKAKIIVIDTEVINEDSLTGSGDEKEYDSVLEKYSDKMAESLGLPAENIVHDEDTDLTYFEGAQSIFNTDAKYVCYLYYAEGKVWMVAMLCTADNYSEMKPLFDDWATTVEFSK